MVERGRNRSDTWRDLGRYLRSKANKNTIGPQSCCETYANEKEILAQLLLYLESRGQARSTL